MVSLLRKILLSLVCCLYIMAVGATVTVNDSGTWRDISSVTVNDSGTWRVLREIYVNDSGTWRLVHVRTVLSVTMGTFSGSFGFRNGTYGGTSYGSVDSDAFIGTVVSGINADAGGILINIQGTQTQSFFTGMIVQDTAGVIRTYKTASATSFTGTILCPGLCQSQWSWNDPNVWTSTTPSPREVILFR